MDVSIAVSLIRGQMGAVVERAVNGAVETVLAEMLKVVGVKFEELKAQVSTLKRDMTALQREKAAKEKENDKIRAMLRYTELKLKYYRQGVEEEMQPRPATSSQARIPPNSHQPAASLRAPRGDVTVSSAEAASSSGAHQTRPVMDSSAQTRASQGPMSPQCRNRSAVRVNYQSPDVCPELDVMLSEPLLPGVSVSLNPVKEGVSCPPERDGASCQRKEEEEDDCDWTISLQPQTGPVDPPPAPAPPSPDRPPQADSSTLASSMPLLQVKQESQQQQEEEEEEEEEEEVICIKEEPEEEQEVMATLLLDCEMQGHIPGSERSPPQWSGHLAGQRNILDHSAFSSATHTSFSLGHPVSMSSVPVMPGGLPPRQALRPWPKDLSLYEEYKLRRNELRRRSLNRRREMEKTLPQPLLADLVRERREKTRLRVARWRAKRKLQACLMSQAQTQGSSVGLSQQHSFDINSQQQLRAPCASTSSIHQRRSSGLQQCNNFLTTNNSYPSSLPFITSSPSSSSLLIGGHNMAEHINQHAVTSSSSQSQVNLSQPISLTDTDLFQ